MAEFKLHTNLKPTGDQPRAIRELSDGIARGDKFQTLLGITGSGKTFTMAHVIQNVQKPTLIISHNKTLAAQLYGEFKSFFPENSVEYFISFYDYYQPEAYLPVTDTYIEKDSSINDEIDKLRLRATSSLISRRDVIVVASVSCIYGIGSPEEYGKYIVLIKKGDRIGIRQLFSRLVDIFYSRNNLNLERGTFRARGDIVEIQPAYEDFAYRIEFFGDVVEKIYSFQPLTGEIIEEFPAVVIYPAKHFISSEETVKKAVVLVNDYEENIAVSGKWKLKNTKGRILLTKSFKTSLTPGERKPEEIKIEFKAPKVKERTDYIIEIEVIPSKGEKQKDYFKITVFPHVNPPALSSKIYLYDPVGETKKLLKKASVKFEEIYKKIPEKGILIIGRKVLSEKNYFNTLASWKTDLGYGIDNAIERGLKVLIFEQPMENILGVKAEERCWRHAFITANNHPAFKGLKNEDFSYLKGDSNLTPAYPDPKIPPKLPYAHPKRFWKWGNDNVVSTFPIFKPIFIIHSLSF